MVDRNTDKSRFNPPGATIFRTPNTRLPPVQGVVANGAVAAVLATVRVPSGVNMVIAFFAPVLEGSAAPAASMEDSSGQVERDAAGALVAPAFANTLGLLLSNFDMVVSGPDEIQVVADNAGLNPVEYLMQLGYAVLELDTAVVP